jgi:hypothetical protein
MPSEVRQLRQWEEEQGRLRRPVADLSLDKGDASRNKSEKSPEACPGAGHGGALAHLLPGEHPAALSNASLAVISQSSCNYAFGLPICKRNPLYQCIATFLGSSPNPAWKPELTALVTGYVRHVDKCPAAHVHGSDYIAVAQQTTRPAAKLRLRRAILFSDTSATWAFEPSPVQEIDCQ